MYNVTDENTDAQADKKSIDSVGREPSKLPIAYDLVYNKAVTLCAYHLTHLGMQPYNDNSGMICSRRFADVILVILLQRCISNFF